MNQYERLIIEIIDFQDEDIVTISGNSDVETDDDVLP